VAPEVRVSPSGYCRTTGVENNDCACTGPVDPNAISIATVAGATTNPAEAELLPATIHHED
jgi:hypothetical protein